MLDAGATETGRGAGGWCPVAFTERAAMVSEWQSLERGAARVMVCTAEGVKTLVTSKVSRS